MELYSISWPLQYCIKKNTTCDVGDIDETLQPFQDISGSRIYEKYFSDSDNVHLQAVYSELYPLMCDTNFFVSRKHLVVNVCVLGERYLSLRSRSQSSDVILAYWYRSRGEISTTTDNLMAGKVDYYFTHTLSIAADPSKSKKVEHIFAKVKWF